jgi:Domain of unknown function (DUF4345)
MNLQRLNRYFLFATALVFALFGAWGLINPDAMVQGFGIDLTTGEGRTLIRASYGGFLLGAAIVFALCSSRSEWLQSGNLAIITLTAPIFLARAIGVAIDGGHIDQHLMYLVIEAVGVALACFFWWRSR